MKCAHCGKSTKYKPSLDDSGKHYIIEASDHGEEEKWAKYCSKCEKPYCGQCCFPQWKALKAKEGLSGPDLAKKLARDPDAYFDEMPICPICGELCSLNGPTKAGCFIATAAFGSSLNEEVVLLKRFRDQRLAPSRWGIWLISFYEFLSPTLARIIGHSGILRYLTRKVFLIPLTKILKKSL